MKLLYINWILLIIYFTITEYGTSSSDTVDIIENQILKAINHIKYISKKKPCTLKIFNCLQNNYPSNYDYKNYKN